MQPPFRRPARYPKSFVLAIAAHVEDGAPRPPELDYWIYREWGAPFAGGWLDWPAAEFARARYARNIYLALVGYRDAVDKVAWCDGNAAAWNLVSYVWTLKEERLKVSTHG